MSPQTLNSQPQNRLLQALSADDFGLLQPHLTPVSLPVRHMMQAPDRPIEAIVFPESGMGSILAGSDSQQIEVGIFGREGMSGVPVLLGSDRSSEEAFVQIAGHGLRMPAEALRQAMRESMSLQQLLLRYAQSMMTQTSHTAFANGRGKVEERLARWLLMSHDRVDGDEVPLTHEFLALMLGVRRAGVTETLHVLEGRGAIRTTRGRIVVADRRLLEESAAGLYGVPEAEYRRLIG
jgi:CRP-like cAMP-binding protein